jgi:hypothetical protein
LVHLLTEIHYLALPVQELLKPSRLGLHTHLQSTHVAEYREDEWPAWTLHPE